MNRVNYFQTSKYLNIIKIIGDSNTPISFSELKEKSNLPDSTLSRGLNWLQNIQTKDSFKTNKLKAYYLEQNKYIQSTGITKSKNNTYKLAKAGADLFNSLFGKEEEISFIDEIVQEYKIYEKLWDFILQNEEIFLDRINLDELNLEPWTLLLFEFFEQRDDAYINQMLEHISGPKNLRLYRFFELLSSLILTHPLWKKRLNIASVSREEFEYLSKIPQIKEEFDVFGTYPEFFCLYKSDKLINSIDRLIKKFLKIYYWKGIYLPTPSFKLIQRISDDVLGELYKVCPRYRQFINDYHVDITVLIKNSIRETISIAKTNIRYPLDLMNDQIKEQFDSNLNRKLFQSEIEDIPSKLLNIGASKELIKEQANRLKTQLEREPYNLKIKLQLLKFLVHNYSHELRNDLDFYRIWHINLREFIEGLLEELLESDLVSRRTILNLGFIFYKNKFHDYVKALKISEELYPFYHNDENYLEILLLLYFKQKEWELDKIENLASSSFKEYPENVNFLISVMVIKIIRNKDYTKGNKFQKDIKRIAQLEESVLNFQAIIRFYVDQLNRKGFNYLSLEVLKYLSNSVQNSDIRLIYARELVNQQHITEGLEIYVSLIDIFPNYFLESEVFNQLLFSNKKNQLDKDNETIVFLIKIIKFLNLISTSIEWHIGNSDFKDYKNNKEEFLSELRKNLKELEPLLNNKYCLNLPLKIKSILLKALGRQKNLESCLNKLLGVSPHSIWANTELALLYFRQGKFNEAVGLLQKVNNLKEIEHYSIPYTTITQFSHLLEINDYNLFQIYKEAKRYHEAIILMEEYILNPPPVLNLALNLKEITKNLIDCYWKESNNLDGVIEKTLKLLGKIDKPIDKTQEFISEVKHESFFLKQTLIDFIFNKKNYSKCLEWLTKFNNEDPNLLEPQHSYFSPFNKNIYYLAECYLNLNNLILAKKYFTRALEDLNEDIRFKSTARLLLINPFPDNLRVNEKPILEENIKRGIRIIGERLKRLNNIGDLIFKTKIEKSIGNISLLIKERRNGDKKLFQTLRDQIDLYSSDRKLNIKIIIACACTINGYLDEMNYYISQKDLMEKFPVVSKFLKLLYLYYNGNFKLFNTENKKLSTLIPRSSLPLILNLHYLRFKLGRTSSNNIKNLFKTIWKFDNSRLNIYGDEKTIFSYLKVNLLWYPFRWALDYEDYVKTQQKNDINLLFNVLNFIEGKKTNVEEELFEFITRFINPDRNLRQYLKLIIILKSFKYPETKYYLMKMLKLEIGEYGLETYGEIAYDAKKLHEVIKDIENFKDNKIRRSRRINWIEEKYILLLLNAYKNKEFDESKIPEVIKRLERNYDVSDVKMRYIKTLIDLRKGYYEGAELKSYQLLQKFKADSSLEWNDEYFRIWIISKILWDLNQSPGLDPIFFTNEIINIFDFEKLNKKLIHFQLNILEVLDHELLEDYKGKIIKFGAELFKEIIDSVDWDDNKALSLLAEKVFFKRDIFSKFDLDIIESIDKLIINLNPTSRFTELHKNYLFYVKSLILFKNGKITNAKKVIESLISNLNEKEIFTTYYDINDFYLEFLKQLELKD